MKTTPRADTADTTDNQQMMARLTSPAQDYPSTYIATHRMSRWRAASTDFTGKPQLTLQTKTEMSRPGLGMTKYQIIGQKTRLGFRRPSRLKFQSANARVRQMFVHTCSTERSTQYSK
jgi:hypothetical protein